MAPMKSLSPVALFTISKCSSVASLWSTDSTIFHYTKGGLQLISEQWQASLFIQKTVTLTPEWTVR
ncbi:hypothetical protein EV197_2159 [Aquimarina brevivitae]|uniref:Uncharacterized protein n=1 Tax=Aquimarina brevivitae TaxID=323412 RepID=A0A4V2F5P9_9FLAO|nr:hypothetical protein EV197_2159 [Aquimarina brevivitae]